MFGGSPSPPPPADTSLAEEQLAIQKEDRDERKRRNEARRRNLRGKRSKPSLLFDGFEGIPSAPKSKLGSG